MSWSYSNIVASPSAREIIRAAFPSNAKLDELVEAAISGSIGGYTDKAFDVMSFARPPSDSKNWMGGDIASQAAGASAKVTELSMTQSLVCLAPALVVLMQTVHPHDSTVGATLCEMFGTLQKALALGHKLQASAQIVLARTLRKYEEKWVTEFQRQAGVGLPSLADIWLTEKKEPSIGALSIQQPGQSDVSPGDSASAAKIADLERKKKAAEKKAAAAEKKLAALTDDEGDGDAGPNAERNKRKKAARKAKAKEKAEAEAAAAAPAASGSGK